MSELSANVVMALKDRPCKHKEGGTTMLAGVRTRLLCLQCVAEVIDDQVEKLWGGPFKQISPWPRGPAMMYVCQKTPLRKLVMLTY